MLSALRTSAGHMQVRGNAFALLLLFLEAPLSYIRFRSWVPNSETVSGLSVGGLARESVTLTHHISE